MLTYRRFHSRTTHPQSLSAAWLARETDPGSWQRGNRYFRDGHARLEQVERLPDGGVLLTGSCQGTRFEPYRQHIVIRTDGQENAMDGEGTVEEKILALQARKKKLAEGVYGSGRKSNEPPIDEATIRALLSGD